jgi:hypothetical protein
LWGPQTQRQKPQEWQRWGQYGGSWLLLEIKMWCLWSRKIRTANFILTPPSGHQKNEILWKKSIRSETKGKTAKAKVESELQLPGSIRHWSTFGRRADTFFLRRLFCYAISVISSFAVLPSINMNHDYIYAFTILHCL